MEIKTKFDIGQKVYWLLKSDGVYEIRYDDIKSINIGGKAHEKYEICSYATRSERELFATFKEAQEEAINKQVETNARALELVQGAEDKGKKY